MKNLVKKLPVLLILLFAALFCSCEKDLYEEPISQSQKITSEKVSLSRVMSDIKNSNLKNYLKNYFQKNDTIRHNISNLGRFNEEELNQIFEKIIKENEYTTYTLTVNEYSAEKPYYENLVIKIDENQDRAGFTKYIPNEPSLFLDIEHFTGKIQLLDLERNVKSETDFLDGQPLQTQAGYCIQHISIIVHTCSHGGGHVPGDSCGGGLINDSYFEIISTTFCFGTNNYIAPLDYYMASSDGTGGGAGFSFSNFFKNLDLNSQQNSWLIAEENQYFKHRLVSPYSLDSSGSEENFVISIRDEFKAKLDFLINNPDLTNDTRAYVEINQLMSEQDLTWNTINQIYESSINQTPLEADVILIEADTANEITNIEEYLECFNLNQGAVFTIYVDQPTPNSNESWSGNPLEPNVGHTFISILQGGIRRVVGLYPGSNPVSLDSPATNGSFHNDSAHHYDVALSFNINSTKLNNLINYIKSQSSTDYNLNSNNCTDFGRATSKLAGVMLLSAYGTWGMPGVGTGAGDNPGQLGQNIRNMQTPSGSIRTTIGGTAPSNQGTCN